MAGRGLKWIYILLILFLTSCGGQEMKFDKNKWSERDDIFYANREKMITDLMENHLKNGMTFKEIQNLLGSSENYQNDPPNTIGYEITVDYGWNIDPQKGKTLYIEFTNDSIVKDFRVEQWKH